MYRNELKLKVLKLIVFSEKNCSFSTKQWTEPVLYSSEVDVLSY
jgi:hypothetical protein